MLHTVHDCPNSLPQQTNKNNGFGCPCKILGEVEEPSTAKEMDLEQHCKTSEGTAVPFLTLTPEDRSSTLPSSNEASLLTADP